jgi:hypothetical protein
MTHFMKTKYLKAALVLLPLAFVCGCGSSDVITCYPVTGRVMVNGQPATGAVVVFHPVDSDEKLQELRPYGTVDSAGVYSLNCYGQGDGAPAGEYLVTIAWEVDSSGAGSDDPEASAIVPDRLGGKYSEPAQSGLEAVVSSGATEVPEFAL